MSRGTLAEGNWCQADFTEALPIYPDRDDPQGRWFNLSDGIYKVVVLSANGTASFLLRRAGEGPLEVYTGSQFPNCLSSRKAHKLSTDGSLHYDSGEYGLQFDVGSTPGGASTRVALRFPAGATYGLTVHGCTNCR